MAKRKNPLKDLDAFLKQEAKSIIKPEKLEENIKEDAPQPAETKAVSAEINAEQVIDFLSNLAENEKEFYNLIQQAIEKNEASSAKQKMLINTLLFLKDKENWKETVKEYWS